MRLAVRSILALIERIDPIRRPVIVGIHFVLVPIAYLLAYLLRFDYWMPSDQWPRFLQTLPLLLLIRMTVFYCFRLHEGFWRYVSMSDILAILKAVTLSSLIFLGSILTFFGHGFPRSVLLLDWVLCLALVGGVRLTIRALRESNLQDQQADRKRAIIVGAGDAGEMLIREIERNLTLCYDVVGFVDDDPRKQGGRLHGIEVMGTIEEVAECSLAKGAQELLIAIPSATRAQQRRVIEQCRRSGVPFKTVPALNDLLHGKARIGQLQEVRPEDLLGREAVRLDFDRLRQELHGKRIMVTGAGGSIGSELCRQLAAFEPELLVLFDRAESSLYFVDLELQREYPGIQIIPVIGDIRERRKLEDVIETYIPDVLYHAAAFKHVPLMEAHPLEAIENNLFGTEAIALAARQGKVKKVVFISTDKAVKPVGIMGMTKRVAECLQLAFDGDRSTFIAVRFGNVLGSDGSVLPLFQKQLARGGPVTITDPEATRYFMLLCEAAQLVLQAGAIGKGGETFFLDMGEPIKILDFAHNFVRLSGFEPGKEIPIEVIGLRPGERLREELVREQEVLFESEHEKIFLVQNHQFDAEGFWNDLEVLRRFVAVRDQDGAVAQLQAMAARY